MTKNKESTIRSHSTKLDEIVLISKKLLQYILKTQWKNFISTYQQSKKKIPFVSHKIMYERYSYLPFGFFGDFQGQGNQKRMFLQKTKVGVQFYPSPFRGPSVPRGIQRRHETFGSGDGHPPMDPLGVINSKGTIDIRDPSSDVGTHCINGFLLNPVSDESEAKVLRTPNGGTSFFYFKKEKFNHYNYFILAKLVDLIGDTQIVHNKIRKLIKIHIKHSELENFIQTKIFQNNIFLRWISYLLIKQIDQFSKITNSFFKKFIFFSPFGPVLEKNKKCKIESNGNFLFFKCQDFLMLHWYQRKIYAWSYKVLNKINETRDNQNFNILLNHSHINSDSGKFDKFICSPQDKISNTLKIFKIKKILDEKKPIVPLKKPVSAVVLSNGNQGTSDNCSSYRDPKNGCRSQRMKKSKQRYFKLIKNILQKSKISTQLEIIQKLNHIIKKWDTFVINKITKKKTINLNLLLYQLLWYWGLTRHKKQKAKWIKNRYWALCPLFELKNDPEMNTPSRPLNPLH